MCLCENQIAPCPLLVHSSALLHPQSRQGPDYKLFTSCLSVSSSIAKSNLGNKKTVWDADRVGQAGREGGKNCRGETVCSFVCICECRVRPGSLMNMNLTEKRASVLHSWSSTKHSLGSSCAWTHTHFCCPINVVVE